MKQYQIFYTKTAEKDLMDIYEYTTLSLKETATAQKLLRTLWREISLLSQMPARFPVFEEIKLAYEMRTLGVGNFIVFYCINDQNNSVNILRVLYGGRDFKEQF